MTLEIEKRDQLFKAFARAFFQRDIDALHETVTEDFVWRTLDETGSAKSVSGRSAVQQQLQNNSLTLENVRYEDVVYHHAPDETFMTFRLIATKKETGEPVNEVGVERYSFKDGLISLKDVYKKPIG